MDKKHCSGCRNNFYNLERDGCWLLKDAKVTTQYEIHMDNPMNVKANYTKVQRPGCYSGTGTALLQKIPHYAK